MNDSYKEDFPEGVKIKIPKQKSKKKIKVKKLKKGTIKDCKNVPGEFTLIRVVIEIDFVDDKDETIAKFDPPLELRVKYTSADKKAAKNGLKLAYCSKSYKSWKRFTSKKHNFDLLTDEAEVFISDWVDPAIGWGH